MTWQHFIHYVWIFCLDCLYQINSLILFFSVSMAFAAQFRDEENKWILHSQYGLWDIYYECQLWCHVVFKNRFECFQLLWIMLFITHKFMMRLWWKLNNTNIKWSIFWRSFIVLSVNVFITHWNVMLTTVKHLWKVVHYVLSKVSPSVVSVR